jgi:hypothetical protein
MIRKLTLSLSIALAALIIMFLLVMPGAPSAYGKPEGAQSLSTPYTQNFDTLASIGATNTWTNDSTLPGWYAAQGSGSLTTYRANNGSSTTGALYSYGSTGSTDRALGSLSSVTPLTLYYGVRMVNDTGLAIASFVITYTGEQWRVGSNTVAPLQKLAFAYRVGSVVTDVVAGAWADAPAFDFVSPVTKWVDRYKFP